MKIYTLYYITTSASDVFIGQEVEWNVLDTILTFQVLLGSTKRVIVHHNQLSYKNQWNRHGLLYWCAKFKLATPIFVEIRYGISSDTYLVQEWRVLET